MKTILSIDCGTQSLRAMLFSFDGKLLAKKQIHYSPYYSKSNGWAEQDADVYWNTLISACQFLKAKESELFSEIQGIGITTIRNSMVNLDKDGNVLRPVIHWLDQRKADLVYKPNIFLNFLFKMLKVEKRLKEVQMKGKSNWIIQNEPEVWKKTFKYLQVSGFLNYKLTGEFIDSNASQIGYIPFSYKKRKWAEKGELSYKLFPIEADKLPKLIEPSEIIGYITKEASLLTGIKSELPVVACGSDKGCETLGMGVLNQEKVSLSFGTIATIQTSSHKYFEALSLMPPYPAVIPNYYNPEIEIFRGFWMITWFKNEFCYEEKLKALEKNIPTEEILNSYLKDIPAGSNGLMVYPYWTPGFKNIFAKGAVIGFSDCHNKYYIYKAIIEGLLYALKEGCERIEKRGGVKVSEVCVSGGASQSDEICQITSDIFNLKVIKGETFETSGLGSAIVVAKGIGYYTSFEEAVKNMVHYSKTFNPNLNNVKIYDKLYKKVYKKIYKSLKNVFYKTREILEIK